MYYSILHKTRYRYSAPVTENVTEVRMQPRSEGPQRCLSFKLTTTPSARVHNYLDNYGNHVHHFTIPAPHKSMTITAEAIVIINPPDPLPAQLDMQAWARLDELVEQNDWWDFLVPSRFTQPTGMLEDLAAELDLRRRADPLTLLHEINQFMFQEFAYDPEHTEVDSPINLALAARKGVCQDFAHIMIALVRMLDIPCRYVSGYLFHRTEDHDRSEQDATHAWVEVLLPDLGWVGFDPTNHLIAGERHIRTAVGRDYTDVPPTRGVFKGRADSHLEVGVKVLPTEAPIPAETVNPRPMGSQIFIPEEFEIIDQQHQQQQQQQQ